MNNEKHDVIITSFLTAIDCIGFLSEFTQNTLSKGISFFIKEDI